MVRDIISLVMMEIISMEMDVVQLVQSKLVGVA
jgi:hypothetical protein